MLPTGARVVPAYDPPSDSPAPAFSFRVGSDILTLPRCPYPLALPVPANFFAMFKDMADMYRNAYPWILHIMCNQTSASDLI